MQPMQPWFTQQHQKGT